MLRRPGSSWRFGALLKGVLSRGIEGGESADIHSPHQQFPSAQIFELTTFGLLVRLSNH